MHQNSLEGLRLPPALIETIQHPKEYISGISKDKRSYRKIFYGVEYTQEEKNKIQLLKDEIANKKIVLPEEFQDGDLLKFVYAGKFEIARSVIALQRNLEWRASYKDQLSPEAADLLNKGVFYSYGRDKLFRPVLIINIYAIDPKKNNEEQTLEALSFMLKNIQTYMFHPSKIENWLIFLETNKMSFFKFPIGILKMIISTLSTSFSGTLERIFILNPSTSFNVVWSGASSFIDASQKDKITFLSGKKEIKKLVNYVDPSQLELKYGGNLPNLKSNFWPPQNTITIAKDEQQDLPRPSLVDMLKSFSKTINERISLINRPSKTNQVNVQAPPPPQHANPLEEILEKKSLQKDIEVVFESSEIENVQINIAPVQKHQRLQSGINNHSRKPSGHSRKPSGHSRKTSGHYRLPSGGGLLFSRDLGRVSTLGHVERISVLSGYGYGRPSNRTVYRTAVGSFLDGACRSFERLSEEDEDEDQNQFYSFYTCYEEMPVEPEEKKDWQKWNGQEKQFNYVQENQNVVASLILEVSFDNTAEKRNQKAQITDKVAVQQMNSVLESEQEKVEEFQEINLPNAYVEIISHIETKQAQIILPNNNSIQKEEVLEIKNEVKQEISTQQHNTIQKEEGVQIKIEQKQETNTTNQKEEVVENEEKKQEEVISATNGLKKENDRRFSSIQQIDEIHVSYQSNQDLNEGEKKQESEKKEVNVTQEPQIVQDSSQTIENKKDSVVVQVQTQTVENGKAKPGDHYKKSVLSEIAKQDKSQINSNVSKGSFFCC